MRGRRTADISHADKQKLDLCRVNYCVPVNQSETALFSQFLLLACRSEIIGYQYAGSAGENNNTGPDDC